MDKHIATLEEMLKDFDGALAHDEIDAVNAAIALMRDDCARRAAMDKHASAQEELAIARATIESLRMRLSGCESALAERDAAIALMRGQSEDRPRDAIDDDNGFRRYPWTYQNQPGNVGAWALGESASKAKPGGDPIDHGLSLLRELHLRGLGIVRVTKLKDTADEQ